MNVPIAPEQLLSALLRHDLYLESRITRAASEIDLEDACTVVLDRSSRMPLIYTAFDGDHQMMCGHMRTYVLQQGCVPANPDSILGYKDTVESRMTKRGVLLDDLAILRGCDELWIFTDVKMAVDCVKDLAEGVAIELLFYLRRKTRPRVRFVSAKALLRGESPSPVDFPFGYDETKAQLLPDQKEGVLDLANSQGRVDKDLPALIFHIFDPLDYKYSQWLRSDAYSQQRAPLIPYLAVELQDLPSTDEALSRIVQAWVRLSDLATRARILPSLEAGRSVSLMSGLLEKVWLRRKDRTSMERREWGEYKIPKAQMGNRWPLTRLEGGAR